MPTPAQLEANRRNALRSTGPRTPEGKSASRQNALKTGIYAEMQVVRGEDPEALAALASEYHDRWLPTTPEERALVDTLVSSEWTLRRLRVAEAQLWEFEFQAAFHPNDTLPLGQAYSRADKTFARLQRRIDATARLYRDTLRELKALRSHPVPDTAPEPEAIAPSSPSPEIGFVPSAPGCEIGNPGGDQPLSLPDPLEIGSAA